MPLHYVLDGYNILKQVSRISKRKLKEGRTDFIRMLDESSRLKKQRVSLVFDGFPEIEGPRLKFREGFEVKFSRKISADDKIKSLVEQSKLPGEIVVVSDDREIGFFTKSLGAKVISVEDFLSWIFKREEDSDSKLKAQSNDKNLSFQDTIAINRELRKIWLKE